MGVGTARYPAPATSFPLRRSPRLGGVLIVLHGVSLMVLAAWLLRGAGPERTWAWPTLLFWFLAATLTARFWLHQPVGELVWDGASWHLQRHAGTPAEQALGSAVAVQLDLQRQMLLAFVGARPAVWLYVEQQHGPARWSDLRRAVYSRPSVAGPVPADDRHTERTL